MLKIKRGEGGPADFLRRICGSTKKILLNGLNKLSEYWRILRVAKGVGLAAISSSSTSILFKLRKGVIRVYLISKLTNNA